MGNLSGVEILVILLVALIVLGPTKLPSAVRQVGRFVGEIRRIGQGFQQELREAATPLTEATAALKAADKDLREAAAKPVKEAKAALKASDPRNLIEPPPGAKDKGATSAADAAAAGAAAAGAAAAGKPPAGNAEDADAAAADKPVGEAAAADKPVGEAAAVDTPPADSPEAAGPDEEPQADGTA